MTGVDLVRVDLFATRDGTFVDDLRPEEIELYEDGTRQRIESFELVRIPARGETVASAADSPGTEALSRIIVLFFDTLDRDDGRLARERVVARAWPLFQRTLGPTDIVGLATREMDPASISYQPGELVTREEVDRVWERVRYARERDPKERLYLLCYPEVPGEYSPAKEMAARRREEMTFDALETLAAHLATLGHGRKVVLLVSDGWQMYTRSERMMSYIPPMTPRALPPLGGPGRRGGVTAITEAGVIDEAAMDRMLQECEADRIHLANLDHRNRLNEIAQRANSGNVSFYPVAPGGVGDLPAARQMDLRALALDTNGVAVVNTNDIEEGIRRVLSETSAYYLIGYVSSNPARDGGYRSISARVTRPGVEVRARRGYRASRPEDVRVPSPAPAVDPRMRAITAAFDALARADREEPIQLRTAAWLRAGSGTRPTAMIWIAGELGDEPRTGTPQGELVARVSVSSRAGAPPTRSLPAVPLESMAFAVRLPDRDAPPPEPGAFEFRASVLDSASRTIATAEGVVIVPAEPSSIGEPLLWRRGRGARSPYVMTTDPRYRRSESLRIEFPAEPGTTPAARVLDRAGVPRPVPVTITRRQAESAEFEWIVVEVTLAPFARGDYAIELTSGRDRRIAAFALVP